MSTHNKGFYEEMAKIIFQLSSNTHLPVPLNIMRQKLNKGGYLAIINR